MPQKKDQHVTTPWPADAIERVKVADLIPYARNARTHSDEQVAQLAASIREWGWTVPILVDEQRTIIAGHGRVLAAQKLGIEDVPTMTARGWTDAQKRAYILADNQLALNAGWDDAMVKLELGDLSEMGFDLDLIGFDLAALDFEHEGDGGGEIEEDTPPDPPADPVSMKGDLWLVGEHRVICGDSTDPESWDRLGVRDNAVTFWSPPYNVGVSAKLRGGVSGQRGSFYDVHGDNMDPRAWVGMMESQVEQALRCTAGAVMNVQPLAANMRVLCEFMGKHPNLGEILTWDKGHAAPAMAEGVCSSRFEWLVVFNAKGNRRIPCAGWRGKVQSVYTGPPQRGNEFASVHGATFPLHLPMFVLGELCNRAAAIVDPCAGTGTTIIAAQELGRVGYGIELSPAYVDVIVQRYIQRGYDGPVTLAETGETWAQVAERRNG